MTQSKQEPEYSLEEKSARMYPQWDHSRTSTQNYRDLVLGKSRQLSEAVNMQWDIFVKILALQQDLEQLLEERL